MSAWAQNPSTLFSIKPSGCLGENLLVTNQSTFASTYEWDICQGDLSLTPTGESAGLISGSNIPTGIDVVYDGSQWYAFITSRNNHSIIRVSLGSSVGNAGSIVNLGNVSSILSLPTDIKIVSDNGKWYAFVFNEGTNVICRLDFGNALTNTPTATVILTATTSTSNQGLDVVYDGTQWYVVYTFNSKIGVLRLTTIESVPPLSDQLLTNDLTESPSLGDIKILDSQGSYFAYTCGWSSPKLYKLSFGNNIFSTPSESDISAILPVTPALNYYGVDGGYDAGFHLILSTLQGSIVKVDLDEDLTSSPSGAQVLGNSGIVFNTVKNRLIKSKSDWFNFSVDYVNGTLFKVSFPTPACQFSPGLLTDVSPKLSFNTSGVKYISLRSFNATGAWDEEHKTVTISSSTAPDVEFSSQNICVNNSINFTPINQSGNLNAYSWSFGDGGTSASTNPSYIYSTTASYTISLTVTASNSCQNTVQKSLQIFNPPQADFTLPVASPFCTNQNYLYTNTSSYDIGSNPAWQWSVNGSNVAVTKDLNYLFTSSSAQSVLLTASIPGCSTQSTQNITTLVDGPLVTFTSPSIGCQGSSILFTNTTTDPVTSFSWDFGDGNSSSQSNASNIYSSAMTYLVKLSATNAAGCQNSSSKNISIYSVPQPDFNIEAIPSSCANSLSQFDNLTPPLIDSNISSWSWSFGDTPGGSSALKNPSYTYSLPGNYNVSLQATSNFGCTKSVQKSISIFSSPQASFTNSPACQNQSTKFTDASTGNISFYQWNVQNSILSGTSPNYTFNSSGTFPVTLSITGSNGCINQITKNITVPVMPVVDFSIMAPCTGHPSVFQELNSGGADPATAWNWNFGQASAVGSPANYQFPTEGGYIVTMTTTRQSGCSYSAAKNISISAGPVASFTPSTLGGAPPLNVKFNNTSTAETYLWQFDDINQTTSSDTSPEFIYTQLGKYKALLTAKNSLGCSDTLSTEIDVVIPRIDIVMNNFSLTNDPNTNSSKAIVTILNSGNVPLVNPEVLINLAGGASIKEKISGLIRPGKSIIQTLALQIVPRGLEYICAEVDVADDVNTTNNKQCVSLSSDDVILAPYPNPSTSGQVTLEWVGSVEESVQVTIFRSNGEIVFEQNLDAVPEGLGQLVINTASFANGLYLIRFAGSKTTRTFRIAIAN